MPLLAKKCIKSFKVNKNNVKENLNKNPILVTALNPIIGYKKAAEVAKKAYSENRAIIDVAEEMTTIERKELESLLDPKNLIKPYF
jgi:fumarate hydratase class II